jgi:Ni/Co efflux regulator RcnB
MTIVPRIRFITIAAACVALAGSMAPASAAAPAQGASRTGANVQGQNQSADQSRKICATIEMTGTRMNRRVCRTAADWERAGGLPGRD